MSESIKIASAVCPIDNSINGNAKRRKTLLIFLFLLANIVILVVNKLTLNTYK